MFSYEFCEIFKNTFFIEHLQVTASASNRLYYVLCISYKKLCPFFIDRIELSQGCRATIRDSFILTSKSPGVSGIHLSNLGTMKGWVSSPPEVFRGCLSSLLKPLFGMGVLDMFINMRQFLAVLWTFKLLFHFDQLFTSNLQSGDKLCTYHK